MEIKRINSSEIYLVIDLFDKYRIFYKQQSDMVLARDFIRMRLDNNESVIFVALISDIDKLIPVGFTQLYPKFSSVRAIKNWILNDLYVEEEFRKQGIGEKLIKAAIDFSKENKARFLELSTAIDNYTAQRLYEQIGFKKQMPDNEFYSYRISLT
ncbi:MAG: GNAT family N-acetyltransferase [Bacteroidia bacterium]|nr:GNAT family N-acetyltransferase [Bacteroidia bacterium]